ncbi:dTMP kinase [uncultured Methanobrevibacter sp.]|mgnify:FL=1|uniref:dTMP kinase n=1 Tax=uncultured Methanobrevibacter sp. TaxID=253161 RepID=UPI0015B888DB|nr:dTMP kinase [uncultured Methanobrevibacter sp.]
MYIIFEGIDGAGKSTQIEIIKKWLEDNGLEVETVVEPTDSEIGILIREILKRPDATTDKMQKTLGLLFAADRMLIMDKLEDDKKIFLSDRSFISSLVYQEPKEWINSLNKYVKKPDLVLLLDVDLENSVSRFSGQDKFENKEFLTKVRKNYLDIINNFNHEIINANNGVNKVSSDIKKAIAPKVGLCKDCVR